MCELMCKSVLKVGTNFGVKRAPVLANDLVAATMRVEEVRHTDIEADDLRHIITEVSGTQGSRVTK